MSSSFDNELKAFFGVQSIESKELIQELWSGYGELLRINLPANKSKSIIAKYIKSPINSDHPRGWNTTNSHLRKAKSYHIEMEWYKKYSHICDNGCRVPQFHFIHSIDDERMIVIEDLDQSGYSKRKTRLTKEESKLGLKWLANFHAIFMNHSAESLWKEGSYWHLNTRPDEYEAMAMGPLKKSANKIDQILSKAKYRTIIHGDAKVANFCFSADMKKIAAVDFQYVGGGCGMKDVAYFLGSCLSENECEKYEDELLNYYFKQLHSALLSKDDLSDFSDLEKEWRKLYVFAWADFNRFLMGWMPTHQKINSYSKKMELAAIAALDQ